MRKPWILACSLTVIVSGSVMAYVGVEPAPVAGQEAGTDEVVVSTERSPAKKRYDALETQFTRARSQWLALPPEARKPKKQAKEPAENSAEDPPVPKDPLTRFVPRFRSAAREYAGTEEAIPFLRWLVYYPMSTEPEESRAAFMTLLRDHGMSPRMNSLVTTFRELGRFAGDDVEEARNYLRAIADGHSDAGVKAWATYGIQLPVIQSAAIDSKEFLAAEAAVKASLRNLKDDRLAIISRRAFGVRREFDLGMVAPGIEGPILDGEMYSLEEALGSEPLPGRKVDPAVKSELASKDDLGRIVYVDFWANSSAPCRAMYARKKALAKKMLDKPFTIVGVSSDPPAVASGVAAHEEFTWPNFRDRGKGRKDHSDQWHISHWPTIVVLDAGGRVRYRGENEFEAAKIAEDLVKKLVAAKAEAEKLKPKKVEAETTGAGK